MGEQAETEFVWVLKSFSSLQDEKYYSRTFSVAGYNWRLMVYPKGAGDGYLSVYLELVDPESLPPGWAIDVNFTLTVVSKLRGKSDEVSAGRGWFDTKHTVLGHYKSVSLAKLHSKGEGILVKDRLHIVAKLHVLPAVVVVREENVSVTRPLSSKDENQADDDDDAKLVDDGAPEDDDAKLVDDGAPEDDSDDDDEGTDDEFEDGASNGTSLDQAKSLKDDASRTIENGGSGFSTETSGTETDNDLLTVVQPAPAKETMDINGFDVFPSQVESVKLIFERHPDIAVEFNAKNQHLRNACLNFLLSLVETLCQSLEKLSSEDLVEAYIALTYLKDAGFKVDWLEKKLDQLKDKKEKEQLGLAQLQEIEETLLKFKQRYSELQTIAEEEKADLSAIRTTLSVDDLI